MDRLPWEIPDKGAAYLTPTDHATMVMMMHHAVYNCESRSDSQFVDPDFPSTGRQPDMMSPVTSVQHIWRDMTASRLRRAGKNDEVAYAFDRVLQEGSYAFQEDVFSALHNTSAGPERSEAINKATGLGENTKALEERWGENNDERWGPHDIVASEIRDLVLATGVYLRQYHVFQANVRDNATDAFTIFGDSLTRTAVDLGPGFIDLELNRLRESVDRFIACKKHPDSRDGYLANLCIGFASRLIKARTQLLHR